MGTLNKNKKSIAETKDQRIFNLRQGLPDMDGGSFANYTFEQLALIACLSSEPTRPKEWNMNKAALYTKIRNSDDGIVRISESEQEIIESGLPFTPYNFTAVTVAFDKLFSGQDVKIIPRIKNIDAPDPRG